MAAADILRLRLAMATTNKIGAGDTYGSSYALSHVRDSKRRRIARRGWLCNRPAVTAPVSEVAYFNFTKHNWLNFRWLSGIGRSSFCRPSAVTTCQN